MEHSIIIIGAGMSGMTAAIYLKRAGHDVILMEKEIPGGQINKTAEVENYPGFLKVDGPTIAMNVYEQVQALNIPVLFESVESIKKEDKIYIKTNKGEYTCKRLIIASGRYPRKLNLEFEEQYIGHGISYCALCDGAFFKGKTVAVVGSGNSALEEALYLSNICEKVLMINRSEKYKGSPLLLERLKKYHNVSFSYQTNITKLLGDGTVLNGIEIAKENQKETLSLDGLFVYIGSVPNTDFLENTGIELKDHFIVTDQQMHTTVSGIYACGDCVQKEVYQLTTAVGDGAVAATMVDKEMNCEENL